MWGSGSSRALRGQAQARRRVRTWVWAVVALVAALFARPVAAGNPDLQWQTLETEHFYVHYYKGTEAVAERMALSAERAYDDLTVSFGHAPRQKTHLQVVDTTDRANGRASSLPYPRIVAHATAPDSLSVLENYDDWIDVLIVHEYVHVVHLDTVHGLPKLVNAVLGLGGLGNVTSPNILQPRWIIEGIATDQESALTTGGRHGSALFDMYLRTAVVEDRLQSIDRATNGALIWPHGSTVYLYGLHFMHYIRSRYGMDKLRELSHLYGGRVIPFGINRAIEDVLGVDFYQLWEEFRRDTVRRFSAQAARIRSLGVREGRRLTYAGQEARHPMWSPDGATIHFFRADGHTNSGLYSVPATGSRIRRGVGRGRQGMDPDVVRWIDAPDVANATYLGDDRSVVFETLRSHELRYAWSDLYLWRGGDPEEAQRLTWGLRASEPNAAPDGRRVAFRRNDAGQSRLGIVDLASGDLREVPAHDTFSQVFTPAFSPDGRYVAYSGFISGGYRDLWIYDTEEGTQRRITQDRALDLAPTWSPDGKHLLWSSDRSGVFNLYAFRFSDESVWQVSNVLGGAFEPAVDRQGRRIAYVGFSRNGFDIWAMPFEPESWELAAPYVDAVEPAPVLEDRVATPPKIEDAKRYHAIKTFYPRVIFPSALEFQSSAFGTGLGASTLIADVVGQHTLNANVSWLSGFGKLGGSVGYVYNQLFPALAVSWGRSYSDRQGFARYIFDGPESGGLDDIRPYLVTGYREQSTRYSAGVSVPAVRHPRHHVDVGLSYRFERLENLDAGDRVVDPNAPLDSLPEVGDISQVAASVGYDSQRFRRFSFWAEQGRSVDFSLSVVDEALGGDFNDFQARAQWTERIGLPWRGHQVLALRLAGGASAGGIARRGAFVVGGLRQDQDLFRHFLSRQPFGLFGAIRGYTPGRYAGRNFALMNAELRVPLADVERGLGTLPAFLRRILAVGFVDGGNAWSGPFVPAELKWGAGAALGMLFRLGYAEDVTVFFEYAHGFDDEDGLDTFRAVVGRLF